MILFYLFQIKPTFTQEHCGLIFSPESAIFLPFFHITLKHCYGKRDHKSIIKYLISILIYINFFLITYYVIISLAI